MVIVLSLISWLGYEAQKSQKKVLHLLDFDVGVEDSGSDD